jgi:hypothetical protein
MVNDDEDEDELEFMKELFRDLSYYLWISTETTLLKKLDCSLLLDVIPEAMDLPEDEFESMLMEFKMQARIYDYNEPVSIVLPEDAEDALEITSDSDTQV